jgi:hypothetical protein
MILESKKPPIPTKGNRSAPLAVFVINCVDLCRDLSQECQQLRQPTRMNMSNLKAEALLREFHYNGVRIPDPGPELTVEQVRDLL